MPKIEDFDDDFPSENMYSTNLGDNAASSSSSNVRSSLIMMGFASPHVDRAIEQNGEDNMDLLLESLLAYSAPDKPESSDSLDSLFGHDNETSSQSNHVRVPVKEEQLDVLSGLNETKASLVRMNFSMDEVDFAINKLGNDAPITELVDFILAARIADKYEKSAADRIPCDRKKDQGCSTEALFGTMEKTLLLLEMGFSEQEVSRAIEMCGSEVPVSELAASIVAEQDDVPCRTTNMYIPSPSSFVKAEEYTFDDISQGNFDFLEKFKGKRPKEPDMDEFGCFRRPKEPHIDELGSFKRPKQELDEDSLSSLGPAWLEGKSRSSISLPSHQSRVPHRKVHRRVERRHTDGLTNIPMPSSCRTLDIMVANSPYFFYGSVTSLSHDSWVRITQFLYAVQPEFVNTQSFSALRRQEGYVHNLPMEKRFHLLPKPPMTIEEAIPHTKRFWPPWDTRKHLSCINSETNGASQLCEKLGRMLHTLKSHMMTKEQEDIMEQCRNLNLLWVGHYKLAPVEPEDLERILGYPVNHTRAAGFSLTERLQSLEYSFQIDTLAYHLSVLKSYFPEGLTVLSLYSGVGGAEIALHRLGIQLRAVVSVEPSETKRKILRKWWENHGISGDLVQLENIQSLNRHKLDGYFSKFGGFDFVISQNPPPSSPKTSTIAEVGNNTSAWDFSLFNEFVRVLRDVRSRMEKKR